MNFSNGVCRKPFPVYWPEMVFFFLWGGTLWQKRLYIHFRVRHFDKKLRIYALENICGRVRNFEPKNVITTVEGPDTFGNIA